MTESREQIERRLAEIEASERAATPAPWNSYDVENGWGGIYGPDDEWVIGRVEDEDVGEDKANANGEFIVEARCAVPYLLKLVRALLPALDLSRAAVALRDAQHELSLNAMDAVPMAAVAANAFDAALAAFTAGQKGAV